MTIIKVTLFNQITDTTDVPEWQQKALNSRGIHWTDRGPVTARSPSSQTFQSDRCYDKPTQNIIIKATTK